MKLTAVAVSLLCMGADALKLGEVVPDLTMRTLDGEELKLSDFRGEAKKVVVLFFQSERCPSAVKAEDVRKVSDRWAGEDSSVKFIAIFSHHLDTEESVRKYVEANKIGTACVFDAGHKAADHLGAKRANTTFVLDREGKLIYRGGFTSKAREWVVEAVKAALEGTKAPESDGEFAG